MSPEALKRKSVSDQLAFTSCKRHLVVYILSLLIGGRDDIFMNPGVADRKVGATVMTQSLPDPNPA